MARLLKSFVCAVAAALALAAPALAYRTHGVAATPFAFGWNDGFPNGPIGVALDGHGSLFVSGGLHGQVYRFDKPGNQTDAAQSPNLDAFHLAFDREGHLFVTDRVNGRIYQVDPSTLNVTKTFSGFDCPNAIAVDPISDDLFVASGGPCSTGTTADRIVRVTNPVSSTPAVTTYVTLGTSPYPDGLAFASDGTLYVAGHVATSSGKVWQVTTSKVVTTVSSTIPATHVAVGPAPSGGRGLYVNVADSGSNDGAITLIDLGSGIQTNILTGGSGGESLAFGPDGCLYASQVNAVLRITNLDGTCGPATGGGQPGASVSPVQSLPAVATAAVVSQATETHKTWREGSGLVQISAARPPVGTTFRFRLDKAAHVRFAFTQRASGRRVKGACVRPTRHNRGHRKCTRTVVRGTLNFAGHAGVNSVSFDGRLSRTRRLKPGAYTLVITATTPGVGSTAQRLKFTIVR